MVKIIMKKMISAENESLKRRMLTTWLERASNNKLNTQMMTLSTKKLKQKTLDRLKNYVKNQKLAILNKDIAYEHRYAVLLRNAFGALRNFNKIRERAIEFKLENNSKAQT